MTSTKSYFLISSFSFLTACSSNPTFVDSIINAGAGKDCAFIHVPFSAKTPEFKCITLAPEKSITSGLITPAGYQGSYLPDVDPRTSIERK